MAPPLVGIFISRRSELQVAVADSLLPGHAWESDSGRRIRPVTHDSHVLEREHECPDVSRLPAR